VRTFYRLGFAPESQIGRAVELNSLEIPGCSPDLINEALRSRDNRSVLKLAVMERKVPPNVHVFRVKEWRWPILVDDVAKSALSKASHDGLIFLEIEHE